MVKNVLEADITDITLEVLGLRISKTTTFEFSNRKLRRGRGCYLANDDADSVKLFVRESVNTNLRLHVDRYPNTLSDPFIGSLNSSSFRFIRDCPA